VTLPAPEVLDAAAVGLAELVRDEALVAADRPRLFKSVGMAWEDLVAAASSYRASREKPQ
jgi:ornithine cyclodeaminase/alanine dehydrogenase-like protein (mu-crystallin family)